MGQYRFIPVKEEHINKIIKFISPEIRNELETLSSLPFDVSIKKNVEDSVECWVGFRGKEILCMFGISSYTLLSDTGFPWLITTRNAKRHKKALLIGTKVALVYWLKKYSTLENFIPASFEKAIRWLRWAGFTIYPPEPIGVSGQLIHRVVLRKV